MFDLAGIGVYAANAGVRMQLRAGATTVAGVAAAGFYQLTAPAPSTSYTLSGCDPMTPA